MNTPRWESTPGPGRRWAVLAAGVVAIAAASTFHLGLAYLLPGLRTAGFTLGGAAALIAAPSLGLLAGLYAWGAAADRWGERFVLTTGLLLSVPALAAAALLIRSGESALAPLLTCLVLAGAAGASVHAASGRLILGWFPLDRRGFAMGVRQTALPLGTALAALTLPVLGAYGAEYAFAAITAGCLVAAGVVAAVVRDPGGPDAPTRPQHTPPAPGDGPTSPYRGSQLWRLHASSAALAVPQITLAAFGLTFLVDERGWTASGGGRLLALAQVGGAGARLLAGWWSDRTGSRTVPLRRAAAAGAVTVAGFAAAAASGSTAVPAVLVPALLVTATIVTLSPNGLAFTAVAERAGLAWAGRALGVQNSGQNAVAALTPPLMAGLAAGPGYPAAFAVAATFSALAVLLVPERPPRTGTAP